MKKIILLTMLALLVAACSHSPDFYASHHSKTAQQIYRKAHTALKKKHYGEAVSTFEKLDATYPFGPYSRKAQLESIYAYYKNDDLTSAITAADRYINLYPRSKNIDYAYYMRGIMQQTKNYSWLQRLLGVNPAWRDLTALKQAFMSFNEIVSLYPNSPYALDALLRMRYIRNIIAERSLLVAKYYYSQKAYIAAVNRANDVIVHFNGTLATPEALSLMARGYQKLGLNQYAYNTYRLLKTNYPDWKLISTLQKQLKLSS